MLIYMGLQFVCHIKEKNVDLGLFFRERECLDLWLGVDWCSSEI